MKLKILSLATVGVLCFSCKKNASQTTTTNKAVSEKTVQANPNESVEDKIKRLKGLYEKADKDCKTILDSNDAMRYQQNGKNITELKVNLSCKKFYIRLRHTGKLPSAVMGHNVVIAKESDLPAVFKSCNKAGKDGNFIPNTAKALAHSNTIVGGADKDVKEDYAELDTSKFNKDGKYKYFCSFPGHFGIMQGL